MVKEVETKSYREWLREISLFCLEKRKQGSDDSSLEIFVDWKVEDGACLFSNGRNQTNVFKLEEGQFQLTIRN